jgi:hypothetical protein
LQLADDPLAMNKLSALFWSAEQDPSPFSILLPWIPSRTRQKKKEATEALYNIFTDSINKRKAEGRTENDAVQFMLDQGDEVDEIVSVS